MNLTEFTGPRGRVYRARFEIANPNVSQSDDVWVIKLKQLLKQRDLYESSEYMELCPLYYSLLSMFEDDGPRSSKHMLEAMLITGEDFDKIAEKLEDPAIPDGLVAGLYHELFYNIRPYLNSVPMMYRYVVQPLLNCNGNRLPLGEIWKLLAYCGGMEILEASGFGTRPLTSEDLAYLLQLSGYRNAAMMLKYINEGSDFLKDNPTGAQLVLGLTELDMTQGRGTPSRNKYGFKQVTEIKNDYANALTGLFHMVYDTSEQAMLDKPIEEKLITCVPTKIEVE